MGFFDFIQGKNNKKYTDEIVNENYEEELYEGYFPDNVQSVMYNLARNVQMDSNAAMKNPNKHTIKKMKETITKCITGAKAVEDILTHNGIYDIRAEHLATAFYLINLSDVSFKDASSFSKNEIKNTMVTNLIGLGFENLQADDISDITVSKVQNTVKYLLAHPTN